MEERDNTVYVPPEEVRYREQEYVPPTTPAAGSDTGSFGWAVLGFFVPIAGLVLYLVWKDERPKDAKRAGVGALVSVIFEAVAFVVLMLMWFFAIFAISGLATMG